MKNAFAIGAAPLWHGFRAGAGKRIRVAAGQGDRAGRDVQRHRSRPCGSATTMRRAPRACGFRAAYTFLDLKVAELGAAVTYHPKTTDDLTVGGTTIGKFGDQYVAIGVQADWKFLLNLHAGLDMRSEKLTTTTDNGRQHHPGPALGEGRGGPRRPHARGQPFRPPGSGRAPHQPRFDQLHLTISARPWPLRSRWRSTAASGSDTIPEVAWNCGF